MVIKYSQLGMAGNLFYPVAIIVSAAALLASLGVFLRLSERVDADKPGLGEHNAVTAFRPGTGCASPQPRDLAPAVP